jgi:predicted nucleic acid-binding protein
LNAYLDASAVVSMFTVDGHTPRVLRWLAGGQERTTLSDWTLAEFSSAIAIGLRAGRLTAAERDRAELAVERWTIGRPVLNVVVQDIATARQFVRSTTRPLRAPDALHLALVARLGLALVSFDVGMRAAAADLGIPVQDL